MVRAVKMVWGHRKAQLPRWREAAAGPDFRLHRTPALMGAKMAPGAPQPNADEPAGTPTERGRTRRHPDRTHSDGSFPNRTHSAESSGMTVSISLCVQLGDGI